MGESSEIRRGSEASEDFRPRLAGHARRQVDRVTGGAVLLYPEGALELSGSADAIVGRCDGTRTVAGIVAELVEEFSAPEALIAEDVAALIAGLRERGLIGE